MVKCVISSYLGGKILAAVSHLGSTVILCLTFAVHLDVQDVERNKPDITHISKTILKLFLSLYLLLSLPLAYILFSSQPTKTLKQNMLN
jgi:hypothetical protein